MPVKAKCLSLWRVSVCMFPSCHHPTFITRPDTPADWYLTVWRRLRSKLYQTHSVNRFNMLRSPSSMNTPAAGSAERPHHGNGFALDRNRSDCNTKLASNWWLQVEKQFTEEDQRTQHAPWQHRPGEDTANLAWKLQFITAEMSKKKKPKLL